MNDCPADHRKFFVKVFAVVLLCLVTAVLMVIVGCLYSDNEQLRNENLYLRQVVNYYGEG